MCLFFSEIYKNLQHAGCAARFKHVTHYGPQSLSTITYQTIHVNSSNNNYKLLLNYFLKLPCLTFMSCISCLMFVNLITALPLDLLDVFVSTSFCSWLIPCSTSRQTDLSLLKKVLLTSDIMVRFLFYLLVYKTDL